MSKSQRVHLAAGDPVSDRFDYT